jgi:hypothetical protein
MVGFFVRIHSNFGSDKTNCANCVKKKMFFFFAGRTLVEKRKAQFFMTKRLRTEESRVQARPGPVFHAARTVFANIQMVRCIFEFLIKKAYDGKLTAYSSLEDLEIVPFLARLKPTSKAVNDALTVMEQTMALNLTFSIYADRYSTFHALFCVSQSHCNPAGLNIAAEMIFACIAPHQKKVSDQQCYLDMSRKLTDNSWNEIRINETAPANEKWMLPQCCRQKIVSMTHLKSLSIHASSLERFDFLTQLHTLHLKLWVDRWKTSHLLLPPQIRRLSLKIGKVVGEDSSLLPITNVFVKCPDDLEFFALHSRKAPFFNFVLNQKVKYLDLTFCGSWPEEFWHQSLPSLESLILRDVNSNEFHTHWPDLHHLHNLQHLKLNGFEGAVLLPASLLTCSFDFKITAPFEVQNQAVINMCLPIVGLQLIEIWSILEGWVDCAEWYRKQYMTLLCRKRGGPNMHFNFGYAGIFEITGGSGRCRCLACLECPRIL